MVLEWNNVASQAVELIPVTHVREIKKEEIQKPMAEIYKSSNALGDMYEKIVDKAVTTLVNFVNRWMMLSKDRRPKPGEVFFINCWKNAGQESEIGRKGIGMSGKKTI